MTEEKQIYKCELCGNIVEVLHAGPGELVCCNKPMKLFKENTVDAAQEKHVSVIEKTKLPENVVLLFSLTLLVSIMVTNFIKTIMNRSNLPFPKII